MPGPGRPRGSRSTRGGRGRGRGRPPKTPTPSPRGPLPTFRPSTSPPVPSRNFLEDEFENDDRDEEQPLDRGNDDTDEDTPVVPPEESNHSCDDCVEGHQGQESDRLNLQSTVIPSNVIGASSSSSQNEPRAQTVRFQDVAHAQSSQRPRLDPTHFSSTPLASAIERTSETGSSTANPTSTESATRPRPVPGKLQVPESKIDLKASVFITFGYYEVLPQPNNEYAR